MNDTAGAMHVDADLVRQLAELLDHSQLTEIEVQDGDRRIRVVRKPAPVHATFPGPSHSAPPPAVGERPAEAPAEAPSGDPAGLIRSPMVGTAYLASEPGARAFAAVGDQVTEGQTLLIIEAMKVMNAIAAPRAGVVRKVIVANGQPVEFDQPLIVVE